MKFMFWCAKMSTRTLTDHRTVFLSRNEKRFKHQPIKTFDLNNQLGYPSISQILIGNKSGAIDHSIELL